MSGEDGEPDQQWIDYSVELINKEREFHCAPHLSWSQECYEYAKLQADACQERSELFYGNQSGPSGEHGQNLFYTRDEGGIDEWCKLEDVVASWYEASETYTFLRPTALPGSENMTQLLWFSTTHVGVATSENCKYVVANFLPPGNIKEEYEENVLLPVLDIPDDVADEDLGLVFSGQPPNNLIVRQVIEGSWADEQSLSEGDRFVAVNDKLVSEMTPEEFEQALHTRPLRLTLSVGVDAEEGPSKTIKRQLTSRLEVHARASRKGSVGRGLTELVVDEDVAKLGMVLSLPPKPLVVRKVTPNGWADSKGIEPGDTFMQMNGKPVSQLRPEDFSQLLTIRPLQMRLASSEEHAAAVKIQRVMKGKQQREANKNANQPIGSVNEWRMARNRAARQQTSPGKTHALQMKRPDLAAAVFVAHDENKDEALSGKEMFAFAKCIEFPGAEEEWMNEYSDLCTEHEWDDSSGLSLQQFTELVDDSSSPYFCCYNALCCVLEERDRNRAATKIQAARRGGMARQRVKDLKKERDKDDNAATKLQAEVAESKPSESQLETKNQNDEAEAEERGSGWFGGWFGGVEEPPLEVDAPPELPEQTKNGNDQTMDNENMSDQAAQDAALKVQAIRRGNQDRKKVAELAEKRKSYLAEKRKSILQSKSKDGRDESKEVKPESVTQEETQKQDVQSEAPETQSPGWFGGGWFGGGEEPTGQASPEQIAVYEKAQAQKETIPEAAKAKATSAKSQANPMAKKDTAPAPGGKQQQDQAQTKKPVPAPKVVPAGNKDKEKAKAPDKVGDKAREEAAVQIQKAQRGRAARKDVDARRKVFVDFDVDRNGFLKEQEMLEFARCLGYDESEEAWQQEYRALCQDHTWNPKRGLDIGAFMTLTTNVDDQYWFDASKLEAGGWEAAARMPSAPRLPGVTQDQQSRPLPPPANAPVYVQAEIVGIDWEALAADPNLSARVNDRIRKALARKLGPEVEDLSVNLEQHSTLAPVKRPIEKALVPPPEAESSEEDAEPSRYAIQTTMKMRAGESLESKHVADLPVGTQVCIIKEGEGRRALVETVVGGTKGWVTVSTTSGYPLLQKLDGDDE